MAFLRIFQGEAGVREIKLDGKRLIIGRNPEYADFILKDPAVSRMHAIILQNGGQYLVKDLDSTSGTLLNRRKIKESYLKEGDNLQIGATVMEFRLEEEPDQAMADADATLMGIANRYQRLPAGMGLNCRILQIEPAKVFEPGDTIMVGKGGIKIDNPFPEDVEGVVLELEFLWPGGARKLFLGEIMLEHNRRLCVKLHNLPPQEYQRVLINVRRGSWVQVAKPPL